MERGVSLRDGKLVWAEKPASGELLEEARAIKVPTPYQSEIGLAARAWMRKLGERLAEGAIFVIDYGFPRHEYYHPQRATGTLMCHYRHQTHGDPFLHPGEQDVTAHVDFSALADAARDAGLEVLGYATQAQFLVNCGITEVLGEANVESALHYARRAPDAALLRAMPQPAQPGDAPCAKVARHRRAHGAAHAGPRQPGNADVGDDGRRAGAGRGGNRAARRLPEEARAKAARPEALPPGDRTFGRSLQARLQPGPRAARSQAPHRRGMAYRRGAHAGKHAVDEPCRRLPAGARRAAAARRGDQRLPGKVCKAPLSTVSCR